MAQLVVKATQCVPSPPLTPPGGEVNKEGFPLELLPSPDASPLAPSVSLKYTSAKRFIQYIRRCEIGKLLEKQCVFLITVAEHTEALQTLAQPSFSRLRAYFEDKFRYDYEPSTEVLRICMPGHVHELFCGIITKAIGDYISGTSNDGRAVNAFMSSILNCNSADIIHHAKQDGDFEPNFDRCDDPLSRNTTDTPPSVSTRPTLPTRRSARLSARVTQEIQGLSAAAKELQTCHSSSPSTVSVHYEGSTVATKWSPDGSWQHEDDTRPTVIVEVAKTQSMESLTSKAIDMIEKCSAKVVLGFYLGLAAGDQLTTAATVTKWTAERDDQGAFKTASISKDFPSPDNVPATGGSITIYLDDFASDGVLNKKDDSEYAAILEAPPLLLNLHQLGNALVKIKEQETLREKERTRASPTAQGKVALSVNRAALRKRSRDTEADATTPDKRARLGSLMRGR